MGVCLSLGVRYKQRHSLRPDVAHALIGKYIYFYYLRHRKILDDAWLAQQQIKPDEVFARTATPGGVDRLTHALQHRFNGDIFPLPSNDDGRWRENGAIRFLAGAFLGDSPEGQMALDLDVYDFSYIPVELLSSIYEQFLNEERDGKREGIVYTPEPLADYVLAELDAVHPLRIGHRILDPCCGSGVFLVLTYRRLIEQCWREAGQRPSAEAMVRLLREHIFGVERDREACSVTAFSLILTLLTYLDPPELHSHSPVQFPALVGTNIHCADFFDDACPPIREAARFDWIVGNPPWAQVASDSTDQPHADRWLKAQASGERSVGLRRLDQAFTWRAGELLTGYGAAALVISATTLVNQQMAGYRQAFFRDHDVCRVTNFAHLRRILFRNSEGKPIEAPAACLVYRPVSSSRSDDPILHFGPFLVDQSTIPGPRVRRSVRAVTLYEGNLREIAPPDARSDARFLWKLALWGGPQDRRTLSRLTSRFPVTLGELARRRGWRLGKGLETWRGTAAHGTAWTFVSDLAGAACLVGSLEGQLTVSPRDLYALSRETAFARARGGMKPLALRKAPHLVILPQGAAFSDIDFVIPSPKLGIAGPPQDERLLQAVTLYLNSTIGRYLRFFQEPAAGIYVDTPTLKAVGAVPCPDFSPEQGEELAAIFTRKQNAIGTLFQPGDGGVALRLDDALRKEVDEALRTAFDIPRSIWAVAEEFMTVRHQLTEGKGGESAVSPPSDAALLAYAEQLRLQVDDFARHHHAISITRSSAGIVATIEVTHDADPIPVRVTREQSATIAAVLDSVRTKHSQWVYVQRSVWVFDGPRAHIVKAARLLDWTYTQAIQDSADLMAEALSRTNLNG